MCSMKRCTVLAGPWGVDRDRVSPKVPTSRVSHLLERYPAILRVALGAQHCSCSLHLVHIASDRLTPSGACPECQIMLFLP